LAQLPNDYVQKVYAGLLGKVIGVRHGSNIEGWNYDRIREKYGEIKGYLFDFKNFAADDDINGPLFFIRALEDYTCGPDLTPREIGLTWLNYTPYEHGFFWWGGYGTSTEQTAYLNLRSGIDAPRSGSIEQNGSAVAEQIGGQIFIDTWGLAIPINYRLAAQYAKKAASVSHDGNGIYGAMFVSACISAAFVETSMDRIIEDGLSVIPNDSEYARMCREVIRFYRSDPDDWRKCFAHVKKNYGYDRYPGICHIIPNAAVIMLSLLYGRGEFSKTIDIGDMCGWDTDCNVGNLGTILGVKCGLQGIEKKWTEPINDFVACSSVVGSLNIGDISSCALYVAKLGYRLAHEEPEQRWSNIFSGTCARFHFELPGSTHAFRVRTEPDSGIKYKLGQTDRVFHTGSGSLQVTFLIPGGPHWMSIYVKTYYRPEDFSDSRYDPAFSPILYPGQTVTANVLCDKKDGLSARLYIKDGNTGNLVRSAVSSLSCGWNFLSFRLPRMVGACIEEAGIMLTSDFASAEAANVWLDDVDFGGKVDYGIDFEKERMEVWTDLHQEVSQFTYLKGIWKLEDGELSGSCCDFGEAYTGSYDWSDYICEVTLIPKTEGFHGVNFRVQGAVRSYAVCLSPNHTLTLFKNSDGYCPLKRSPFRWTIGKAYRVRIRAEGNIFQISVDGCPVLEYTDCEQPYLYGQIGMSIREGGHCHYRDLSVTGI
jgi:ADP-ribosylglycohydrolase